MIRAAVCLVLVAFIGQIKCEYFNHPDHPYNDKVIVRYLDEDYTHPDTGSYVLHPYPGNTISPSGHHVNVQCPAATPRHIHVKAGSSGKPNINVVAPPNPSPVTVQCPHTAGSHILVHGAPNPQPIITFDHNPHHGVGGSIHPLYGRLYSRYYMKPFSHKMFYNRY